MANDSEHLCEEEHLTEKSPKEKQSGKVLQLTDFFKPSFDKTRNTLRLKDNLTKEGVTADINTSTSWKKDSKCNGNIGTTTGRKERCGSKERKNVERKVQSMETADIDNKSDLTEKSAIEEVSYLDFLNQSSDVSLTAECDAADVNLNSNFDTQSDVRCSDCSNLSPEATGDSDLEKQSETSLNQPKRVGGSDDIKKTDQDEQELKVDEKCFSGAESLDETGDEMLPLKKPKGYVAITNFFVPSAKKVPPVKLKKRDSDEVVVSAEVHSDCLKPAFVEAVKKESQTQEHDERRTTKCRSVRCNAVADNVDLTITHLETVFLTLDKPAPRKPDRRDDCVKHENVRCQLNDKEVTLSDVERKSSSEKKKISVKNGQITLDAERVICSKQMPEELSMNEQHPATKATACDEAKSVLKEETRTRQPVLHLLNSRRKQRLSRKRSSDGQKLSDITVKCANSDSNAENKGHSKELKSIKAPKGKINKTSKGSVKLKHKGKVTAEMSVRRTSSRRLGLQKDEGTCRENKAISQTYKATLVNPQTHGKGTPLKMKFTRVTNLDTGDDELFTPRSRSKKQLSKAGKLLRNAKMASRQKQVKLKQETKTPNKCTTSETVVRRSSRVLSHNSHAAVKLFSETSTKNKKISQKEIVTMKKQAKDKKRELKRLHVKRKQAVSKKTVKKEMSTGVKIAPIFKKGAIQSKFKSGKYEVELSEEEKQARCKREMFLRSGVPEALKKHLITENVFSVSGYVPLVKTTHTQQITVPSDAENNFNVWQLEENPLHNIKFQVRCKMNKSPLNSTLSHTDVQTLTNCNLKQSSKTVNKELTRKCIKPDMILYLLAEIATSNPSFPVHQVYGQLLAKKTTERKNSVTEQVDLSVMASHSADEGRVSKGKKRKNKEQMELESNFQRKRQKPAADVRNADTKSPKSNSEHQKNSSGSADIINCQAEIPSVELCGTASDLLWTDKYAPSKSDEVLGNRTAVRKVATWLNEWKNRTDLEIKNLLKEEEKNSRENRKGSNCDSTYGGSDEDEIHSDNDDDHLCNTMLITGPHGSGKTAMIYALAQELGYKIFEVNAASRRSGRQILSQLQEATQSHQVSTPNVDDSSDMSQNKGTNTTKSFCNKPASKAFSAFFKTKSPVSQQGKHVTDPRNLEKQKQNKNNSKAMASRQSDVKQEKGNNSGRTKKGLNLSSVSLIVFDEADLVFEEDKGFWVAIETFISTTKRPIVLTASDPHFREKLHRNIEQVSLKRPEQDALVTYLQLVCLVEDLRTSFSELCPLVTSCNNDLRKLLLLLQFWSESGASCYGSATDIHYDKKCLKDTLLSQRWESRDPALGLSNCSKTLTDQGSEDQFQKRQSSRLKRRDGPRRTRTSAREFTESVPGNEDRLENTVACLQNGENSEQERLVTKSFDDNTPLLEDMIFYSITGGSHYIEKWQSKSSSLQVFSHENEQHLAKNLHTYYLDQQIDLVHSNILELLALPNVPVQPVDRDVSSSVICSKTSKTNVLFDSDESLEEGKVSDGPEISEKMISVVKPIQKTTDPEVYQVVADSLSELASVCDAFSVIDSLFTQEKVDVEGPCSSKDFMPSFGYLSSGQLDDEVLCDSSHMSSDMANDISAWISLGHLNRCNRRLDSLMGCVRSLDDERRRQAEELMSVVNGEDTGRLHINDIHSLSDNEARSLSHVTTEVTQLLQYSGPRRSISIDYLPVIRSMCRTEQSRMETENKRRFLHYLDGFVKEISDATLWTLCSSLQ